MVPNTTSIRDLRHKTQEILGRLADGPVVIMNRSEPQGVIVSIEQWNEMEEEMQELRVAVAGARPTKRG